MRFTQNTLVIALLLSTFARSASLAQQTKQAPEKLEVKEMVKAISEQPLLAKKSFYYDPGFQAVGGFAIHNHLSECVWVTW